MAVAVAIFAHNEERRIGACLAGLPLGRSDTHFHVLVNGSTDRTAALARAALAGRADTTVHDWPEGGKARSWNRFVHEVATGAEAMLVFMDGDAELAPGSIDALQAALEGRGINAAAGMPLNGRNYRAYQQELREEGGLFGDLYALSGDFVRRIRAAGLRLPDDVVGEDGLVAAWAMTDLGPDAQWDRARIAPADGAGFRCEPVGLLDPRSWRMQYRRMTSYSVRYFQNRIIADIMTREGPAGLPPRLADLYPEWLPRLKPRGGAAGWFDRKALARMTRQDKTAVIPAKAGMTKNIEKS